MLDFKVFDSLRQQLFGNTITDYLYAAAIFIGVVLILTLVIRPFIGSRLHLLSNNINSYRVSNIIRSFNRRLSPITYTLAVYLATSVLVLRPYVVKIIDKAVVIFISVAVIMFFTDCIRIFTSKEDDENTLNVPQGIVTILKVIVWILGGIFIAANLGANITAFITGLGIGGMAIALASQNILADLFNYIVMIFDKPFHVGDLIQIDNKVGKIEYIGVRTTRLRSGSGEQLLIANSDLTKARVQNFQNMEKRRNITVIGVEYGSPSDKLKILPQKIREIVENTEGAEFARVHFSEFGASSLNFELCYYVLSSDYGFYMDKVQSINYAIYDLIESMGLSFAFPSQTIYMAK